MISHRFKTMKNLDQKTIGLKWRLCIAIIKLILSVIYLIICIVADDQEFYAPIGFVISLSTVGFWTYFYFWYTTSFLEPRR